MQAFKLYFRIFKKSALISSMMYLVIFSLLTMLFTQVGSGNSTDTFSVEKCRIAIINNDGSPFSNEFENYIKKNSKIVEIDTSEKGIKDALLFRNAEYIITIPKDYGKAFEAGTPINIETRTIPNSTSGAFVELMLNNYLKTFDLYLKGTDTLSFNEIVTNVNTDLAVQTQVQLPNKGAVVKASPSSYYFNFTCYPIMCVLILTVGLVLNSVNEKNIRRRNLCAPINSTKFSLQIFLGNVAIMLAVFGLFVVYAFKLYPKAMTTTSGLLQIANLFILSLVALSLSFLIGNIAGKKAIQPICNTVTLAFCFLGGAFVPQELLSQSVKNIAVVDPVFWFVKANNSISSISNYDWGTLKPIVLNMGIEFAFAVAFLAVALVVIKQKRTKN